MSHKTDWREIQRQVWQTLADYPEIGLHPSDERFHWQIEVDALGLRFDPVHCGDWKSFLLQVKSAAGAIDAVRDELKAIDEAIMRQWEEEDRSRAPKKRQEK
jgi:hypothetical protein